MKNASINKDLEEYMLKKRNASDIRNKSIIQNENIIEKETKKEYDVFLNHAELEINTATNKVILKELKEIKKILLENDNNFKATNSKSENYKVKEDTVMIIINNPRLPFGEEDISKEDILKYLPDDGRIIVKNNYIKNEMSDYDDEFPEDFLGDEYNSNDEDDDD
jgi:hypothetical protein